MIVLADACPAGVIWAGHYREDGSCECTQEVVEERPDDEG
jgi:hypothetical protein